MSDELVAIGRVVKAHGIRGEVAVHVLSDVPGRFDPGTAVRLEGRAVTIETSRPHQGRLLVRFAGVTDRTAAERLRGHLIEAPPVDVSASETYYAHELIDMAVVDEDGAELGTVSALIELPGAAGYDLLEVAREDGSTWLLPAAEEFVEVDATEDGTERLRLVDPPAGLLDPGDAAVARPDAADGSGEADGSGRVDDPDAPGDGA